jgi:predicted glutamine amidotransferase
MCRLLGAVADELVPFRLTLHEAPRSLAVLSREHPDGWGVAVYDPARGWTVQKGTLSAHEDSEFHDVAAGSRGEMLVAHIRKRTVGPVSIANTHPFQHGRWVFAHNGTLGDTSWIRARTSNGRLGAVRGETDSELFFAFLLARLDAEGLLDAPASSHTDRVLAHALSDALARPDLGAVTFLLSDGKVLYAHRSGRTLFLLERYPGDEVRVRRESHETGAVLETPWTSHRSAVLVASEQITDEPWLPLAERALIRIDRHPVPRWKQLL